MTSTFEQVKSALRISHGKFDDVEIKPLIAQARHDLELGGVPERVAQSEHGLVTRAIIHFARLNFPLDGIDPRLLDRYEKAYLSAKTSLILHDWSEKSV